MKKSRIVILSIIAIICFSVVAVSYAQENVAEKETFGKKVQKFWQMLWRYPANATQKSIDVVADTTKSGTRVVSNEVKRVGEVTSGELKKTPDLVTGPATDSAETVKGAVEETVKIPVDSAKEDQK